MSADSLDVLREAPAPFLLLDGILSVDAAELTAWRQAGELPFFLALEAAAQAADACPIQDLSAMTAGPPPKRRASRAASMRSFSGVPVPCAAIQHRASGA